MEQASIDEKPGTLFERKLTDEIRKGFIKRIYPKRCKELLNIEGEALYIATHPTCQLIEEIDNENFLLIDYISQLKQNIFIELKKLFLKFGIDFNENAFIPETNQFGNKPKFRHQDYNHVFKRIKACLCRQILKEGDKHSFLLIDKRNILKACEGEASLDHIVSILAANSDAQLVVTTMQLIQNQFLQEKLLKLGFWKEYTILRSYGRANLAFDAKGLTRQERLAIYKEHAALLRAILGTRLNIIGGLSSSHIMGIPRDNLLAALYNVESIIAYFKHVGDCCILDLFCSTDDLEMTFSTLVLGCGWKPRANVALGYLKNIDILEKIKRDPDALVKLPATRGSKNPHHQHRMQQRLDWFKPLSNQEWSIYYQEQEKRARRLSIDRRKRGLRDLEKSQAKA